jgi:transcriptional regulator with XRE-family HTH domain
MLQADIPQKEHSFVQHPSMRQSLDNQLALFLRKKRGEITYAVFARKLGITPSSLFRLENRQQSVTLKTLQQILDSLKCELTDVFHPEN